MRRMQIQLAPVTYEAVRRQAYQRRVSLARVVREAVERYVAAPAGGRASIVPDGFGFVGIGRSRNNPRSRPVSVHHDEALAEDLARRHGLKHR